MTQDILDSTLLIALCDCHVFHRVKSFTFKEREVTVEIPKPLLLADIIVRLQITKNDVYTPLSRTGKPASRPPSKTAAQPEGVGEGDPPTGGVGQRERGRSWPLEQRIRSCGSSCSGQQGGGDKTDTGLQI